MPVEIGSVAGVSIAGIDERATSSVAGGMAMGVACKVGVTVNSPRLRQRRIELAGGFCDAKSLS